MSDRVVVEIPSLFGNTVVKKLTFDEEGLKIERPTTFAEPVFLKAENIHAFRYGMNWVRGYQFAIGRYYFIEIEDERQKIVSIKLRSYYGIKKSRYEKIWREIFNELLDFYFNKIFSHYADLHKKHQIFELAGVKFLLEGVGWGDNIRVLWDDIAIKNYRTYFVIHPKENPKFNKSLSFSQDWNALLARQLLKNIITNVNPL